MQRYGDTIYTADICRSRGADYVDFTRKGNILYAHIYFWPGDYVAFSGLRNKVSSVRLLKTGQAVQFEQSPFRLKLTGLPKEAPDQPVTTFASNAIPSRSGIRTTSG